MRIFNFNGRKQTIGSMAPTDKTMYTPIAFTGRVLALLAKASEGYLRSEYPSEAISELFDLGYAVTWHGGYNVIEVTQHVRPEAPCAQAVIGDSHVTHQ